MALAVDLIAAVPAAEQVSLVRELRAGRPEVARGVLDAVLLERAMRSVPAAVLGDGATQLSLDDLLLFLRGTEPPTRAAVEAALPERLARLVAPDLELDRTPPLWVPYQRARAAFAGALRDAQRREGGSPAEANAAALGAETVPAHKEAAE